MYHRFIQILKLDTKLHTRCKCGLILICVRFVLDLVFIYVYPNTFTNMYNTSSVDLGKYTRVCANCFEEGDGPREGAPRGLRRVLMRPSMIRWCNSV